MINFLADKNSYNHHNLTNPYSILINTIFIYVKDRKTTIVFKNRKCPHPASISISKIKKLLEAFEHNYCFICFKSKIINLYYLYLNLKADKINGNNIRSFYKSRGLILSIENAQRISSSLKKWIKWHKQNVNIYILSMKLLDTDMIII